MKQLSLALRTALAAGALVASSFAAQAGTLETVKARGILHCGTSPGVPGFSLPDAKGEWSGLDVDLCRAVAAMVFKDASKVKFIPLNPKDRFSSLQSGEIDLLSRQTTWTLSREAAGMSFTPVTYYDGQALLVRKALNVKAAKELSGASVCVQGGTTTELNVADFFRKNNIKYEPVNFGSGDEAIKAFEAGRCDAFTTDASALFAYRLKAADPSLYVVLPEMISKEPLGPVVRRGDEVWGGIIKWAHYAMLTAEELGLNKANIDEAMKSSNPDVRRFVGLEDKLGERLGVSDDWAYQVVKQVGNYGESYDRNVGPGSRLAIPRGLNNLWTNGGLQYAPPLR